LIGAALAEIAETPPKPDSRRRQGESASPQEGQRSTPQKQLLLAGGLIGLLFIRPEQDRRALARHALSRSVPAAGRRLTAKCHGPALRPGRGSCLMAPSPVQRA